MNTNKNPSSVTPSRVIETPTTGKDAVKAAFAKPNDLHRIARFEGEFDGKKFAFDYSLDVNGIATGAVGIIEAITPILPHVMVAMKKLDIEANKIKSAITGNEE